MKIVVLDDYQRVARDYGDFGSLAGAETEMLHEHIDNLDELILACRRHVVTEDRALRDGRCQTTVGTDLAGSTLGVLGLGRLGSQVARIGQAFGMRVVAWSRNLTAERAAEAGTTLVSKQELFAGSDVVTVHLTGRNGSR